jgi:RNA polymerase sigma factor (sigma-70 family)
MSDTDRELIARYARHRAEDAFAELVRRHLDLVHSAALRQVRSPHLAEEVAQSTFLKLAHNAPRLAPDTVLTAWLYQVTRREAIDVVRREARRQLREQIATEMNAPNATAADWAHIEPLLDEAIHALDETDRAAVVLRYFENKSLREVGQALGASENAAQKRLTRAVEQLRDFFAERGVAVGASGLAVAMSAYAVQAAPAGIASTISAATLAATAVQTSIAIAATNTIVMTTLQKALVTAAVIVGITTPWVIQHQTHKSIREDNESLRLQVGQIAALAAENERLSNLVAEFQSSLAASQEQTPMPRLPAPQMRATAQTAELSTEELQSAQRIAQLLKEDEPRRMTAEQVKPYLEQNRRNATSLLAAFRATGDPAFLHEALEKHPNNPQVNFAAAFKKDATPEERRQRLESFKRAAPENSLGNYLSALDYFKSGDIDQAVRELTAASGKAQFQDYTAEFLQDNDEVWRMSNYPTAEAKLISATSLQLGHLAQLKLLAQETVSLADSYRLAGDATSAQLALQMGANVGQRVVGTPSEPLVNQLVGVAIESIALRGLDPASPYGDSGNTVQGRLDELVQQRSDIRDLTAKFAAIQSAMSAQDWISYMDRWRLFGEDAATRWAIVKHGQ